MSVCIRGARSAKGETGTTRATGTTRSAHPILAASCPPAEWPVTTTGPATMAEAARSAWAISSVIAAIRALGASV